jgi:amino acid permease
MKSMKVVSFGVIAGIIIAATLLILFVTGAIDQDALTSNLGRALAIIGIMVFAFLGIVAVSNLNNPEDSDK